MQNKLEYWSDGVLEHWKDADRDPSLQYSNTPLIRLGHP